MRKLQVARVTCSDSFYPNNGIRNSSFSQVTMSEFFELQISDEKTLNILVFLIEVLETLMEEEGFISIYHLIDLTNQDTGIEEVEFPFLDRRVSLDILGNNQFSVLYEFRDFQELKGFFEQEFMNFVNFSNGIWIDERPDLRFLKEPKEAYEPLRHEVSFQTSYVEIGDDADYIRVLFKSEEIVQNFIRNLRNLFDVTIVSVEYDCSSEPL